MKYKKYVLGDLTEYIKGYAFKSKDFTTKGIPIIKVGNLNNGLMEGDNWVYLDKSKFDKYQKVTVRQDDVIISTVGSWASNPNSVVGKCCIIPKENENNLLNQNAVIVRSCSKEVLQKYLGYVLKNEEFKNYIVNCAQGSASQASITLKDIKNFKVNIPVLILQQKVIKILASIEKKIKLNNQINNNLLEMINTQYNDYVRSVSNFDILAIRDIFDFSTGVEPGSKNYLTNKQVDTINFYRVGDMNSTSKTFIKTELAKSKFVSKDDILISFDATIGRIAYGLEGSYSTGIKKVSINNNYKDILNNSIVFAYFNNNETQETILKYAKGTTILHAGTSIDHLSFKYNENEILRRLPIISSAFEKMKAIKSENQILEQLRDTLLPKLMNGEIDLKNIKI